MMRVCRIALFVGVMALLAADARLYGQSFRHGGTEFAAMRPVEVPADKSYSIVVAEFLHHGQINPDGKNIWVATRNREPTAVDVLQLGPGDFCRVAFQTLPRQTQYEIYYGGPPPKKAAPPWTAQEGLRLETRQYEQCNLNSLDAVRKAFDSAVPIGADYVENIHHAHNPFQSKPAPFLSRYSGNLWIKSAGRYGFLTSSRDCSFLLIDGKEVVSAPGRHPPARRALPGSRKDIQLSAGRHRFEYYHAAAGPDATMTAYWEVAPKDDKPNPTGIPTETFRTASVAHLPAGRVTLRVAKLSPDFSFTIEGDVPLPDNDEALIGVRFQDNSPPTLKLNTKTLWDFGDGQTGDQEDPDHVYLRPGVYKVTLSLKRGSRSEQITHRVAVDRPLLTRQDKLHTLDEYLAMLEGYNPHTLDAASLVQLVLAYEAKALSLEEEPSDTDAADGSDPNNPRRYFAAAVAVGKVALLEDTAARDGPQLYRLTSILGPMARDRLGDSTLAHQLYREAVRKIRDPRLRSDCAIEAADLAVHDLLNAADAKLMLDGATRLLADVPSGPIAAKLQRVWGDYHAMTGDGKAARTAYDQAKAKLGTGSSPAVGTGSSPAVGTGSSPAVGTGSSPAVGTGSSPAVGTGSSPAVGTGRNYAEQTAWRGAYSRSAEAFLKSGETSRAAKELRTWQSHFPTEKTDGYLTLLWARYYTGRQQWAQAVAQAEQLQTVNPDSPYADQLLLLAAECEQRRGRNDRALATLRAILTNYPGSPLIPDAKKAIARLETPTTN